MSHARIKPSIQVSELSFVYANGMKALDRASFQIDAGSITALVGVNGSGKSTLFKSIMGFLKPQEGGVRLSGFTPSEAMRAQLVAYVPQSEEIDWNFPVLVRDVVMMGRFGHMNWFRWPRGRDKQSVEAALARVDMLDCCDRQIGELSGGQRKRVFLARALAQEASIMLLDEPFTGIDVTSEMAIIDLLRELRTEGRIILISTHNLGSVPDFCDQTILINKSILAHGATSEVFTQNNLERTFGGLLRHFVLSGDQLHDDEDPRRLVVLSDDERPFVIYGDDPSDTSDGDSQKTKPLDKP